MSRVTLLPLITHSTTPGTNRCVFSPVEKRERVALLPVKHHSLDTIKGDMIALNELNTVKY